jgi:TolB protein
MWSRWRRNVRASVWMMGLLVLGGVMAGTWRMGARAQEGTELGDFSSETDVGTVLQAGSAKYDAATQSYTVTGSGENIWAKADAFHYVWKKMSGDVSLGAEVTIATVTGNPHRKAVLMIRQSLDADAVYVDAALHGNGLASLQYRDAKGALTHEIESAVTGPAKMQILKRGDRVYLFVAAKEGDALTPAGASIEVPLTGEFYVGIGVCAHDKDAQVTAAFSQVEAKAAPPAGEPVLWSAVETVPVASGDRHVTYVSATEIDAPNWTKDGGSLIFNRNGRLERLAISRELHPVAQGEPVTIETGAEHHCNDNHALSPDGQWIAFSDTSLAEHFSRVYVAPVAGGTPRSVTENAPSDVHGWSPDGNTLAFTGQRKANFDIYTIPAAGGVETRLTTAKGVDDGPEFSPDGQWIYFNSDRTGRMQIWRMHPDGSGQEQVAGDDTNDWFPHLSPDGKLLVYLAYGPHVHHRLPNQDVELRMVTVGESKVAVLAKLLGGEGTINGPSWSPDSKEVAFVSYELME